MTGVKSHGREGRRIRENKESANKTTKEGIRRTRDNVDGLFALLFKDIVIHVRFLVLPFFLLFIVCFPARPFVVIFTEDENKNKEQGEGKKGRGMNK